MNRPGTGSLVVVYFLLAGCSQSFDHPDTSQLAPAVGKNIDAAREKFATRLSNAKQIRARAQAWGELCQVYHAHHLMRAAAACYQQAIHIDREDFRWHYFLGHVQRDLGQPAEAIDLFRRVLELEPENRSAQFFLAQSLIDTGVAPEAIGLLRKLDHQQREPAVAAALGQALLLSGDYDGAISALTDALDLQPDATRLHYPLAMALRSAGEVQRATEHLRLAGKVEPVFDDPLTRELAMLSRSAQFYIERGRVAMEQGDNVSAEEDFRIALSIDAYDAAAQATLALLLQRRHRPDEALQHFNAAIAIDADNATYHYLAGALLERMGKLASAAQGYRRAVALDPAYPEPRLLLGHHAMRERRFDDALVQYRAAAEAMPQSILARYHGGLAALAAGHCDDALLLLDAAYARQATYAPVIIALARARAVCSDDMAGKAQALELAQQLYAAAPNHQEIAATMAMALASNGRFDEALQSLPADPAYDDDRQRYQNRTAPGAAWPADAAVFQPPALTFGD